MERGYLKEDFALYNLDSFEKQDYDYHYHLFNKVVVFISGDVTYWIEGRAYLLNPYDVLLVNHHLMHKVEINKDIPYHRIILWINEDFVMEHSLDNMNLLACFDEAKESSNYLLRLDRQEQFKKHLEALIYEYKQEDAFGSHVMKNAYFIALLVLLNRKSKADSKNTISYKMTKIDCEIREMMCYIDKNVENNISIDQIASKFYKSRYHIMHQFKSRTGTTLYKFIQKKKMVRAKELLDKGHYVQYVSDRLGYKDYSTFYRCFKKEFGITPRKFMKDD